ncbi:MAG: PQQ-binding-like beta-propeller repeat protein [Deltaproteobacteria bacterium]|nr:PQQ-binding-like beta-propeller repeat protein [Deltaproteobacteria bacterium]
MGYLLILTSLLLSNPFKLVGTMKSPVNSYNREVERVLSFAPRPKIRTAIGYVNIASAYNSYRGWFTDGGNLFFLVRNGRGYKLTSVFRGSQTPQIDKFPVVQIARSGVNPLGETVLADSDMLYFISPSGKKVRKVSLPFIITDFHCTGNGQIVVWGNHFIASVSDTGKVMWKHFLPSNIISSRFYSISDYFLIQLSGNNYQARSWKDGRFLWSRKVFGPLSTSSWYGFLVGGDVYSLKNGNQFQVIDGKKGAVKKQIMLQHSPTSILPHPFKKGMYVFFKSRWVGYYDYEKEKYLWMSELGAGVSGTYYTLSNGDLVFLHNNKNIISINSAGRIIWSTPVPDGSQKIHFMRMPGGNLGLLTYNRLYVIYPPGNTKTPFSGVK